MLAVVCLPFGLTRGNGVPRLAAVRPPALSKPRIPVSAIGRPVLLGKTIVPVMHRVVAVDLLILVLLAGCNAASTATARVTPSPSGTSSPIATATPSSSASLNSVRYVAIGASDTVGVGAVDPARGSWPARIAALLPSGAAYVNLGVSGSLALQAQREQLPGAVAQRPTVVTVWLAVNDLNAGLGPGDYGMALRSIVTALVDRTDARIFVGNVPDLRAVPAYAGVDQAALAARIADYNLQIAALQRAYPARVVVVDLFTGSAALVSSGTVAADGFHPSDAGYQLIADRFVAALRDAGVPLRA